jgi:hypothetical protein
MEEKIGRETLQELIKLEIGILSAYQKLLTSDERGEAKKALNKIIKAAIDAVAPVLEFQHAVYNTAVPLHEYAVEQTRQLLAKLLEEEQTRAAIHNKMREEAEGRGRQK